jgi:hypothetical protein
MSTPHFPGWYPDPDQPARERLWDGQAWTHHVRKAASDSGGLSARAIAVATVSAVLGLVLIAGLAASGSDRDASETALPAPVPSAERTSTTPTLTPKMARVPAVKGLSLTKAKRKLRTAGLEVGDIDRRPSSKRKGTVLEQSVDKGTKLELSSSVDLVVAVPLPQVASVIGKQEASAIKKLKNAGFRVKKAKETRTSGKDGVVLSQSPGGGTRAKPKSLVRIVISKRSTGGSTDSGRSNCTPGYSPCLPPASDYDCRGGSGNGPKYAGPVRVTGSDPYDLDRDGDGKACEWS